MVGVQAVSAMLDRYPGSDPVGAIFEETLEQLGPLERELMLFSATSNVLAVRWLLHLGARWDAGDTNNSTCLHVACRAGSIPVVTELLSFPSLLQAVDMARWTPLHIAAFMGRREVVVRLLNAHADPTAMNFSRQTPIDLCFDGRTLDAFRELSEEQAEIIAGDDLGGDKKRMWEDNAGNPECEHIPFFLPPIAALHARDRHEELWAMAVLIFNMQPSYGLGFAVATGLSCSYAEALLRLLHRPNANRAQVGGFLGEALSLSFLTRLSLFDSVDLQNTGVVSALRNVFRVFQLPEDFQKTNRLLLGLAQVWWRKHKQDDSQDDVLDCVTDLDPLSRVSELAAARPDGARSTFGYDSQSSEETVGSVLKGNLSNMEALSQLMFSTVLLHRFVHGDGNVKRREFSVTTWMSLNKGLGYRGGDIPASIQRQIYQEVCRDFIKELSMAAPRSDISANGEVCWERCSLGNGVRPDGGGPDEGAGLPRQASRLSCLTPCATMEGWAQQRFIGAQASQRDLSEVPASRSASGAISGPSATTDNFLESLYLQSAGSKVWLSLCDSILFLWTSASRGSTSTTPHMFIDIVRTRVERMQALSAKEGEGSSKKMAATSKIVALVGAPEPPQVPYNVFGGDRREVAPSLKRDRVPPIVPPLVFDSSAEGEQETQPSWEPPKFGAHDAELPLTVVHLLPDGRWQEINLVRLELEFANEKETEAWATRLADAQASATTTRRQRKDDAPPVFPNWVGDMAATEDHSEAFAGDLSGRFVRPSAACKVIRPASDHPQFVV